MKLFCKKAIWATALAAVMLTPALTACKEHPHEYIALSTTPATCEEAGFTLYQCACGKKKTQSIPALGHELSSEFVSYSRLLPCTREGCNYGELPSSELTLRAEITFTFNEEDEAQLQAQLERTREKIAEAGVYDGATCAYDEGSALYELYRAYQTERSAFVKLLSEAGVQYTYASALSDVQPENEARQRDFAYISEVYNAYYGEYSALYGELYESGLREYAFRGMTQAEIDEFIGSGVYADEEYLLLSAENEALKAEHKQMDDPAATDRTLELYAQTVENNNRIAQIFGYENYMDYAYEQLYLRDYTPAQTECVFDYVKQYISPLLSEYVEIINQPNFFTFTEQAARDEYRSATEASFLTDVVANELCNGFLAQINGARQGGEVSYLSSFETLFQEGNYLIGPLQKAYTSWNFALDYSIIYIGEGLWKNFTVVHEFGHYMNAAYNSHIAQTQDLAETHSQGLEMLYLNWLQGETGAEAYEKIKTVKMANAFLTVVRSVGVDAFERAVYTNSYDGLNGATIMADGTITPDEYDFLYQSIMLDLGAPEQLTSDNYWRYVTVPTPAYYLSYALSLVCSTQLYTVAENEGFDTAVERYLKLVFYSEDSSALSYREVLAYAGLNDYLDEALYQGICEIWSVS